MSKLVWDDDIVAYIIAKTEKAPFIWDPNHSLFKNKVKKQYFYQKVAEKINKKFNPPTELKGLDVQRKWNNLKSYNTAEKLRIQKAISSGASEEEIEKVRNNWKFRPSLTFLPDEPEKPPTKRKKVVTKTAEMPYNEALSRMMEITPDVTQYMKTEMMSPHPNNGHVNHDFTTTSDYTSHLPDESMNMTNHSIFDQTLNMSQLQPKQQILLNGTDSSAATVFGACVGTEIGKLAADLQIKAKKQIFAILMDLQGEQLSRNSRRSTNSNGNKNEG